jgi:hypothetical protein
MYRRPKTQHPETAPVPADALCPFQNRTWAIPLDHKRNGNQEWQSQSQQCTSTRKVAATPHSVPYPSHLERQKEERALFEKTQALNVKSHFAFPVINFNHS